MFRTQISFNGISTTPTYNDGDCYSLVNLRPKNGVLQPVTPRKVEQTLSKTYNMVFRHRHNEHENWLGVVQLRNSAEVWWNIRGTAQLIDTKGTTISGTVVDITQLGYVLSVITDKEVYYILYREGRYIFYGAVPQLPAVNVSTDDIQEKKMLYTDEYPAGTINKTSFVEFTKGMINKVRLNNDKDFQCIYDAHILRYAFRMFDGSLVKHSGPILVMPRHSINNTCYAYYAFYDNNTLSTSSAITQCGWQMKLVYDFRQLLTDWQDVIESIDFFLSPAIGVTAPDNIQDNFIYTTDEYHGTPCFMDITRQNVIDAEEMSAFYLIKSVGLEEYAPEFIFPKKETANVIANLIFKEQMSNDAMSHHSYGAGAAYSYNSRLHLGDVSTGFFNGFSAAHFQWGSNLYNQTAVPATSRSGNVVIETTLRTGTTLEKVYSFYAGGAQKWPFFNSYISYPDTRAKSMNIYVQSNGVWYLFRHIPLKKHNFLNLAYYIEDGFKPIVTTDATITTRPPYENKVSIRENNKLRVSEVNNPFTFSNTYLVGHGNILAMASNVMNVSDRNYGQYPLYVFTDSGVWSLQQGEGDVVYSNVVTPAYSNGVTSRVVCSTPYGVAFVSQQGLFMINGTQVTYLSAQLEQAPLSMFSNRPDYADAAIYNFGFISLKDCLNELTDMGFDPGENELILLSNKTVNYTLNLDSKQFYMRTDPMQFFVKNTFPQLIAVGGNNYLKNFAAEEHDYAGIGVLTRPMRLSTTDVKQVLHVVLRGILHIYPSGDEIPHVMELAQSPDGINFSKVNGTRLSDMSQTDIQFKKIKSLKTRYITFALGAIVGSSSRIDYMDITLDKTYNNEEMR